MGELMTEIPTAAEFYEGIAAEYGGLFTDEDSLIENRTVFDIIGLDMWEGESILDLGCGLGTLLDYVKVPPSKYLGVDISPKMVTLAQIRHIEHAFRTADVADSKALCKVADSFPWDAGFGFAVSTFGVLSYVENLGVVLRDISAMLRPDGKMFFMVYQEGYAPETHERFGRSVPHKTYPMQQVRDLIEPVWKRGMVLDLVNFVGGVGLELDTNPRPYSSHVDSWLGL